MRLPDMRAASSFFRRLNPRGWAALFALVEVAALLIFHFFGEFKDAWRNFRSTAADARSEKIVKGETDAATVHEGNANDAALSRQINEARANDAQAEKDKAAANSNLTAEPTRQARQRYEKTRRTPVAPDAPDMSDADICAELARRNISSPGCQ